MSSWLRKALKKALKSKTAAKEVAQYLANNDIVQRYLLQTSQAVDIVSGGVKINALPEKVFAVVNHRIAVESTPADIRQRMTSLLEDKILPKFDVSLDSWGEVSGNTSSSAKGRVSLDNFDAPLEPSPVSPYTTDPYKIFSGTIKQIMGKDIIVAPTIMTGNTDTKYYWNLSKNIYRFSAVRDGLRGNAHTVDEFMSMAEHVQGVKFYAQIILNGDL
jgi:Gly-Xaa carboxypeptidase